MLAIIGGSGLTEFEDFSSCREVNADTLWGKPSAAIQIGRYRGVKLLFLPRHGKPHKIPPHKINYRANIQALKDAGASQIIAINTVGGINDMMLPPAVVIPDQLIDYTHGRIDTFHQTGCDEVVHIDFTSPYSQPLREQLIDAARENNIDLYAAGTHAITQGPRLETAAEIMRYERDGCDIVGMTGMPEASLARELKIDYACCALVVNRAAGKTQSGISMQTMENNLKAGIGKIYQLIACLLSMVQASD